MSRPRPSESWVDPDLKITANPPGTPIEAPPAMRPDSPAAPLRTTDVTYGKEYWDTLDGGAGYQDSVMWSDIAHIVHETYLIDHEAGVDRAGECPYVDVGCAMGFMVLNMQRRGVESWGLDVSEYALEHAPAEISERLRWFDLTGLDPSFFGTERFGLATCFETLEHIEKQFAERSVRHLYQLLKPGGYLLATICVEGQEGWDTDPTHVNIRPRQWWHDLFAKVGFVRIVAHEEAVRRWWLFSRHKGVIAAQRPG